MVSVRSLSELVAQVKDEQGYIIVRERTHRNTAESTNARVKWWSIFQLCVLAAEGIFQVWWLKRFFEVRCPQHAFDHPLINRSRLSVLFRFHIIPMISRQITVFIPLPCRILTPSGGTVGSGVAELGMVLRSAWSRRAYRAQDYQSEDPIGNQVLNVHGAFARHALCGSHVCKSTEMNMSATFFMLFF